MDVYILRHGKAADAGPGMRDADRGLTRKGREEIALAGRWIAAQEIRFDLIASSPLVRAQETAAIIAESVGDNDNLVTWKVLAPGGGNAESVCRKLAEQPDMYAVLLVGHEPLLSSLIGSIITGGGNAAVAMTKGALAKIRDFSCSGDPSGELHWLVTAAQMAGKK